MDLEAIKKQIHDYRSKYASDPDVQIMLTILGQMIAEVERLKEELKSTKELLDESGYYR